MEENIKNVTDDSVNEELETLQKNTKEKLSITQVAELIKKNFFTISFNNVDYKIIKPNGEDLLELYETVAIKKTEMLLQKKFLPAEALKKSWKDAGIDLYETEKRIEELKSLIHKYEYQLGKSLEDSKIDGTADECESKIVAYKKEMSELSNHLLKYLDISLETRIHLFQYSYLTYLMVRKNIGTKEAENWVKAFGSYKEFLSQPSEFTNKLNIYTVLMMKDELEIL